MYAGHLEDVHGVLFPPLAEVEVRGDAVVATLVETSHAIPDHARVSSRVLRRLTCHVIMSWVKQLQRRWKVSSSE